MMYPPKYFVLSSIILVISDMVIGAAQTPDGKVDAYRKSYMRQYANDYYISVDDQSRCDFEVLFFDLDGNGQDEALIADSDNRDRSGNGWAATRKNAATCKIEIHPVVGESGIDVFAHSWKLYVVSFNGVRDRLYGNDVTVYDIKDFGTRGDTQKIYQDNVLLKMDTNGFLRVTSVKNGFTDLVSNPGFRRLDRAVTEFYKGFDVKFDKRSSAATDLSLSEPADFDGFVKNYREETKRRLGIERKVTVYAVLFDANDDGDADFFMSSDAEREEKDQYKWHLYLVEAGKCAKAGKKIWFNGGKEFNREFVEPVEIAGRNSFYRVQREFGFKPSVVILDSTDGNLHSRTALRQVLTQPPTRPARHLSYEQRREYYSALDEWEGKQKAQLGFIPAYDFEELVLRPEFLRLERLECRSFPED